MTKIAIMSDIHSNTEALNVVLAKCLELGIKEYAILGDIVGYNAEPAECIASVRSLNVIGRVRGNHDEYAGNVENGIEGFNENAQRAVLWTAEHLSDDDKKYLMAAPYRVNLPKYSMTLVHATLDSPEAWGYIFDEHHAADNFTYQFTQLCFCGHSHVPVGFCKKPVAMQSAKQIEEITTWTDAVVPGGDARDFTIFDSVTVELQTGHKYLLNVGSIGQPRNKDPRASFAVYDSNDKSVTRYRVPYDIAATQAKIREVGLPERLAERLASGT